MRFRNAKAGDAAAILAIYGPVCETSPTSFELAAPSLGEMKRRVRETTRKYPWLVCEDKAGLLGYAYASLHRSRAAYQWCVEVSVYVHGRARRKGVGRALYLALFRRLRAQGYCRAYAGITLPNAASVALHESLGFKPVGVYRKIGFKLGRWHDVGWWDLRLGPLPAAPRAPHAP